MKTISQAEKSDVLLVLALAFGKKFAAGTEAETSEKSVDLVEKTFGALNNEDFENLKSRAEFIDELPAESREQWQETWLDNIRRRGRAVRLDENINPSHIVESLVKEPITVQNLILKNLPSDLSRRISLYLDLRFNPAENNSTQKENKKQVNDDILAAIKQKFLSNFTALEDIFEPDELDKFTVDELERFVRHLGLREVAIACRGINSKETLAAFLNRFSEEDTREIALYLTELEKIRPFWVAQADELVRKSWSPDLKPEIVLRKIGLKLLAIVFVQRDENQRKYAGQKLSIREVKKWHRLIALTEKKYRNADNESKLRKDKRRKIIERLAVKFKQTGRM
jgi:hypothetical protein